MKTCAITCTKGRHSCLERSLRMFLSQDYENAILLIYNNSCTEQRLNTNLPKEKVILINNCADLETGHLYTTLGAIYRDALTFVPEDIEVICFWDDDDLFLPSHISQGISGLQRGGKSAYKPKNSYYKEGVSRPKLINNTFEPSIFVKKSFITRHGFHLTTSDQHLKWVDALLNEKELFEDPKGKPTLVYTWKNGVFKTSGSRSGENFKNYEKASIDHGDRIISPASEKEVSLLLKNIR